MVNGDLISRSALLDSFRKCYCGHLGMENSDGMLTFRSICRIINAQPTTYNVEKVVEEMEKYHKEEMVTRNPIISLDSAISIVRNGGKE